jgi:hypothetical protein
VKPGDELVDEDGTRPPDDRDEGLTCGFLHWGFPHLRGARTVPNLVGALRIITRVHIGTVDG